MSSLSLDAPAPLHPGPPPRGGREGASPTRAWPGLPRVDARWYQILCLSTLLIYGVGWLEFDIGLPQIAVSLGGALLTQVLCARLWRQPFPDLRSPLISGLSLCLLLRSNHLAIIALGAFFSIFPKYAVRVNGKHVFNPTNLGVAATILVTGQAWVSPGQWGNAATAGFFFACLGGLVLWRADRSDITLAFLLFYGGLVFGRSAWLGEPLTIPWHRLQSGALLLFAFFMISDPRATPDRRVARVLFAGIVAFAAWYWTFRMFRTNGLIWALAALSPLVPVLDRLLPAPRFEWGGGEGPSRSAAPTPG